MGLHILASSLNPSLTSNSIPPQNSRLQHENGPVISKLFIPGRDLPILPGICRQFFSSMKAIKRIIYLSTWELFKLIKETSNDCSKLFLGRLVFLSGSFLKSMNSIYSSSITIPKQKIHQRLQHPCHLNYASFICCWNISLLFLHLSTDFLNVLYLLPLMPQLTFASPVGPHPPAFSTSTFPSLLSSSLQYEDP